MTEPNPYDLAGDHVRLTHDGNKDILHFSATGTGRVCGSCSLCCKLLPIPGPPLHKPAGVRCQHQRTGKGCTVYADRPMACRVFACRWLADLETAGMPRPDRCHYVIDLTGDYVELVHDTGERQKVGVVQVWVDPAFPDAWRAPELRAYMLRIAIDYRMATIIRFSSRDALTVFPPPLATDGQWHEQRGGIVSRDPVDYQIMADLERRP
jgi:hypothetical protein